MNLKELKRCRTDALLGALGAFLMLVGDLCLSVIPASPGDSGLFLREAYLNGSWEAWRLPLLVGAGLPGMALGFFTVRMSYRQVLPQYRKTRLAVLAGGVIYVATAGALHLWIGSLADWTTVLSARLGPEETAALIQAQYGQGDLRDGGRQPLHLPADWTSMCSPPFWTASVCPPGIGNTSWRFISAG